LLGEFVDQKGADLGGVDVGRDEAGADPARQDERQLPSLDLLVLRDEFHQAVGVGQAARDRGDTDRQADGGKMTLDALGF